MYKAWTCGVCIRACKRECVCMGREGERERGRGENETQNSVLVKCRNKT